MTESGMKLEAEVKGSQRLFKKGISGQPEIPFFFAFEAQTHCLLQW